LDDELARRVIAKSGLSLGSVQALGLASADGWLLQALFVDPIWWTDPVYVDRRQAAATEPGAWESLAVARFRSPLHPPRSQFWQPDDIKYENIDSPTLFVVGAQDLLREPGYAEGPAARIGDASIHVIDGVGHCPNIERPDAVAGALLGFFAGHA
jgi:pimeloyl-ACP methyl ester carboxylesterase